MRHLNLQPTFGEEESLTAYLFDELGAEQRGELERRLAEDAALRGRLAELREALAFAREGLADEPLHPVLRPEAIERMRAELGLGRGEGAKVVEVAPGGGEDKAEAFARRNPRFVKFLYYAGSISAAATFVVAVFGPPMKRQFGSEAQIARAKAEQRSLATASESYYVEDLSFYPRAGAEAGAAAAVAAAQPAGPLDGKAIASAPEAASPAVGGGVSASRILPDPARAAAPRGQSNGALFMAADIDKDGKISRNEVPKEFEKLFDSQDADHDGFIGQRVRESTAAPAASPRAGGHLANMKVGIVPQPASPASAAPPKKEPAGAEPNSSAFEAKLDEFEWQGAKAKPQTSPNGAAASVPAPQPTAVPMAGAEIASASSAEQRARSFDADFDMSRFEISVAQKGRAEKKQGGQPGQIIARVRTAPSAGAPVAPSAPAPEWNQVGDLAQIRENFGEADQASAAKPSEPVAGDYRAYYRAEDRFDRFAANQPLADRQLAAAMPVPPIEERREREWQSGPQFVDHGVNPFVDAKADRLSTFAIDVDKASYVMARNYLNRGALPPAAAVRVEEVVNYFPANYPPPTSTDLAVYGEMAPSPFGAGFQLLRIGVKGREIPASARKPLVLTFVIDVSGSMQEPNKLVLVKRTLQSLLLKLREDDKVGVAVYGTNGRELMPHVSASDGGRIMAAIDALGDEGSTNAGEGLMVGYAMARRVFDRAAVNRVILCSDGVANTGATHPEAILAQVAQSAGDDIYLTTLGFGMGTYNDALMEKLADKGNGHYAYLDSDAEARHFLETDLLGSMEVIAQDCKIQVEFDPAAVAQYRLLGFENRDVADKDFRNDKVDAGEIGAGHSVTALYELQLAEGSEAAAIATVRVRYKKPGAEGETMPVKEIAGELKRGEIAREFAKTEPSFKLAACAAEFAEILRNSYWARGAKMEEAAKLFDASFPGNPPSPEAAKLRGLMDVAAKLTAGARPAPVAPAPPRRGVEEKLDHAPKAIEMKD